MPLKDIMSISGHSGLFKFISQGRNGIIVESLTDGKRTLIPATAKASALTDIAIFTSQGEKPLSEVLESLKQLENGQPTISPKSDNEQLKAHFLKVEPEYDAERVYVSDIKKVFTWYNLLQSLNLMDFLEPQEEATGEAQTEPSEEPVKPKPQKAAAPKQKPAATKKVSTPKVAKGAAVAKKTTPRKMGE